MVQLPWLLLLLPLATAALIHFALGGSGRLAAWTGTASAFGMLGLSVSLLVGATAEASPFVWLETGMFHPDLEQAITLSLKTDRLALSMMLVVTIVGALVHLFSLTYMAEDKARPRYYAGLSLFLFSMTGIVLAGNLFMMFIFWELVGLSSSLLIGHWFTKKSAAEASKKAFLTNRIGDFGFLVGILLIWGAFGTVDFNALERRVDLGNLPLTGGLLTAGILCLFAGAVGKSAQFPLHVWLPDAMEGPTPVSALIHAATMVAAGVYMLVRISFLIALDPTAAMTIAWIGGGTALLAALLATQQDDIKRVLAYSTLSQLGYMVMAVGLLASQAAYFHLFTHAFFKALLFLGAGAVIYCCHHEQNIWKMGGLAKRMPLTFATFAIGTACLIAVPYVTSGFYSKEAILDSAYAASRPLFWIAAFVALLTAFYMTRLVVVAFLGKARSQYARDAVEAPTPMAFALTCLTLLSIVGGFRFFAEAILPRGFYPTFDSPHHNFVMAVSIICLLAGVVASFLLYRGREKDPLHITPLRRGLYIDDLYTGLIRLFQDGAAAVAAAFDRHILNGFFLGGTAALTQAVGSVFRRMQPGSLHFYLVLAALGIMLLIWATSTV